MFDIEKYYHVGTIREAVLLLKEHPDARLICGGTDVLIKIREGKLSGASLVGISSIKEIKGCRKWTPAIFLSGQAPPFPISRRIR